MNYQENDSCIWKTHPFYKNYECNKNGEIRYKNGRILKHHKIKKYFYVRISSGLDKSKTLLVHRFILESFKGFNDLDVNHIDGDKSNNKLNNLEWVTKSENCLHRERIIKTGNSKKVKCLNTGVIYNSTKHASEETGINQSNINQVCLGNRKTAGKLKWIFI